VAGLARAATELLAQAVLDIFVVLVAAVLEAPELLVCKITQLQIII
jgi:hypothetical protein